MMNMKNLFNSTNQSPMMCAQGGVLAQSAALVLRVLMIHDYRRLILKDPLLASKYLPDNWQGTQTRDIVSAIYPSLKRWSKDRLGDSHSINSAC